MSWKQEYFFTGSHSKCVPHQEPVGVIMEFNMMRHSETNHEQCKR